MTTHRMNIGPKAETALIVEPSHFVPVVSLVFALRTGAAADALDKLGLSRIATRMVRRGHEGSSAEQTELTLDRLGAELLVDTTSSSVAIHATVLGRNLDAFIDLFCAMLHTPAFPEVELERLKRETLAELIESRDNDRVLSTRAMYRALFPGHPYGRSAAGTTATLPALTLDDIKTFHRTRFVPANVVLGFSGDVTPERAQGLGERMIAGLSGSFESPPEFEGPSVSRGRRLILVDKPDRTQVQLGVGRIGSSPHDEDHHALLVANAAFGGTFTSRLMKEIRTERGWSYGTGSRISLERQRHAFQMYAAPSVDDAPACLSLMVELLERFVDQGITRDELEFVRSYMVHSAAFDVDTSGKRLHRALDVELLGLPLDYYESFTEKIRRVRLEEANRSVKNRLSTDSLIATAVATREASYETLRRSIPSLESSRVVAYDSE